MEPSVPQPSKNDAQGLRSLPSVNELAAALAGVSHGVAVRAAREAVEAGRNRIREGQPPGDLEGDARARAELALSYRDPALATAEIPVLRMLTANEEELRGRAQLTCHHIGQAGGTARLVDAAAKVGGGALPLLELTEPACDEARRAAAAVVAALA